MAVNTIEYRVASLREKLLGKETDMSSLGLEFEKLLPHLSPVQQITFRHLINIAPYKEGECFERWSVINVSRYLLDIIVNSDLLPKTRNGEKIVIYSPSANASSTEFFLQRKLGDGYIVIAGDLADVKRFDTKTIRPLRADASFLPFSKNVIHVIYDGLGALWYEALEDEKIGTTKFVDALFKEYYRILREGGMVIIDIDTACLIDKSKKDSRPISGFRALDYRPFRIYYRDTNKTK